MKRILILLVAAILTGCSAEVTSNVGNVELIEDRTIQFLNGNEITILKRVFNGDVIVVDSQRVIYIEEAYGIKTVALKSDLIFEYEGEVLKNFEILDIVSNDGELELFATVERDYKIIGKVVLLDGREFLEGIRTDDLVPTGLLIEIPKDDYILTIPDNPSHFIVFEGQVYDNVDAANLLDYDLRRLDQLGIEYSITNWS